MANRLPTILVHCRYNTAQWRLGLPPLSEWWTGPIVVVMMSPLCVNDAWGACLDADEWARISQVRHPEVRAGKLAAHTLLRLLLACIDRNSPQNHSLLRDVRGRPQPSRLPGWSCSLSHDLEGVAVAIGAGADPDYRLGVDLCRPLFDSQGLLGFLSAAERSLVLSGVPDFAARTLARCWASKEATLKRWGWGLIPDLQRICTLPGTNVCTVGPVPPGADRATATTITSCILEHGAAVAVAHHPAQVPSWWLVDGSELDAAVAAAVP